MLQVVAGTSFYSRHAGVREEASLGKQGSVSFIRVSVHLSQHSTPGVGSTGMPAHSLKEFSA